MLAYRTSSSLSSLSSLCLATPSPLLLSKLRQRCMYECYLIRCIYVWINASLLFICANVCVPTPPNEVCTSTRLKCAAHTTHGQCFATRTRKFNEIEWIYICEKLQLEEKELECSHRFPEAISIAIAQCTSAVCIYSQLRTGGRLHKESSGVFAFSRAHAFMCVCGVQRPHHIRMHIAIANGVALDYFRSALIRVHIILEFCAHSYSVLLKF